MLRGAPSAPVYLKERAPTLVNQLGVGDLNYNSLNGSGWSFWTQTDWSGGFQRIKFKDDATFKDGQAVDVLKKYGEVKLQYGWTSAARISGSHSYGAHGLHDGNLLFGTVKSAGAKIFRLTSAGTLSTLSAMSTISAANDITRFKTNSIIGLTKQTAASASVKSMLKYDGTTLSGFRSANPIVRSVHAIGIRLYSGERVSSLSGDVLYYTTDLSTFTSAYQAGKNRKIGIIDDINGAPYFFVIDGQAVQMFRWDEFAQRAYPIYTWENLTNFGTRRYLSYLMITGTSNGKSVAYAFNGARLFQVFEDQLLDSSYDFSKPFEFEGNLQLKGATWDAEVWVPGIYGKLSGTVVTPFENLGNRAYGFAKPSASELFIGYRDTSKYAASGYVISSEFGSNIGGVDKLVNSVDINAEALATGQVVEVFRSVDGGQNFSSIGKMQYSIDGAVKKKTLYFPSGFVTKLWNYKVQLAGPTTSTPTLNDLTFQYRPVPDLRKRWTVSIDAGDTVMLLNKQEEQRDGKALMGDLWLQMETKKTVTYEDVDAFEVQLVSAMTSGATSARINNSRLMPPRGRVRVRTSANGLIEEMTYTSADGGAIKGITRGQQSTLPRAYSAGQNIDNYYSVVISDMREAVNNTDQNKTESIAQLVLLEV